MNKSTFFSLSLTAAACVILLRLEQVAATYIPTNIDVAVQTASEAVANSLAVLDTVHQDVDWTRPVLVTPQAKHDANWIAEHSLVSALLNRGFEVMTDSTEVPRENPRLSYRVVDLNITGFSGLRGEKVKRRCSFTLGLRLISSGELIWQHEATSVIRDVIPKIRMDVLENATYDFVDLELEERSWGRFIEPVLVSSVLGFLVYLFFSNR